MKTFNLVSVLSVMAFLAAPTFVEAQNFRSPYGGAPANMGAPRTFLGLPLPQQWTGSRPASTNQFTGNGPNWNNRNFGQSSPCANRRCASGSCSIGTCSTGTCSTGNCGDGQYTTRRPVPGQPSNSNCANGQCRLNQYPDNRSDSNNPGYGAQGNWSPRATRSNAADPFRAGEYQNRNDRGTPRSGFQNPMNDLMPSRYNSDDLDLRRPYFNEQSGELINNRASESTFETSNVRAPHPAKRSLIGAPADRAYGVAQIWL